MRLSTTVRERHLSRRYAFLSGMLWSFGRGLFSTPLILHIIQELNTSRVISAGTVLTVPYLVGLLRLFVPWLTDLMGNRKKFCMISYLACVAAQISLLLFCCSWFLDTFSSHLTALALFCVIYCISKLLNYMGNIAFFAWLGDIFPLKTRGRFFGFRERWCMIGEVVAILLAASFTGFFAWQEVSASSGTNLDLAREYRLSIYFSLTAVGIAMMLFSTFPLAYMIHVPREKHSSILNGSRFREIKRTLAPLMNRPFLPVMVYAVCLSFFTGFEQAAQNIYPSVLLNGKNLSNVMLFSLSTLLVFRMTTKGGQLIFSSHAGRLVDRFGPRNIILYAQFITAFGPVFYLCASKNNWVILWGAWFFWIAYVGINVALPNLIYLHCKTKDTAPYFTIFYTLGGLASFIGIITGTSYLELYSQGNMNFSSNNCYSTFHSIFYISICGRLLTVVPLLCIKEKIYGT